VVLTRAATTTSVACSAADAVSRVSAPHRRSGSRGVHGASGSRCSTTRRVAKRVPTAVGPVSSAHSSNFKAALASSWPEHRPAYWPPPGGWVNLPGDIEKLRRGCSPWVRRPAAFGRDANSRFPSTLTKIPHLRSRRVFGIVDDTGNSRDGTLGIPIAPDPAARASREPRRSG
jgi:hypothetical protein